MSGSDWLVVDTDTHTGVVIWGYTFAEEVRDSISRSINIEAM
jgi:hypothetical protein